MAEFKKLSEVEQLEAVSENASVLVEEDGDIKRVPASAVGGSGSGQIVFFCKDGGDVTCNKTYADLVEIFNSNWYELNNTVLCDRWDEDSTPSISVYICRAFESRSTRFWFGLYNPLFGDEKEISFYANNSIEIGGGPS